MNTDLTETVRAVFQNVIYQKDDKSFCVYAYREYRTGKVITAIGSGLCSERDLLLELTGTWGYGKNGKKQFEVLYYDIPKQVSREGVISYLHSLNCGIGPKKGGLVYDCFGENTWDILDRAPDRLGEVRGIGSLTLRDMKEAIKKNMQQRKLIVLFSKANTSLSAYQANAIISRFGSDSFEKIKENPFCICGVSEGLTFEKSDALADMFGIPDDDPNRLCAYIYKLLSDASVSGHVCLPKNVLLELMMRNLGLDEDTCKNSINEAYRTGSIRYSGGMIYIPKHFDEESAIACSIKRMLASQISRNDADFDALLDDYETAESSGFRLAQNQRDAVKQVLNSSVSIITGGPGTGKTTVIKAVLAVHKKIYGEQSKPVLLAPTGKAARRMSEATGRAANTIHAAVGYKNEDSPENPSVTIDGNLVIIDEVSMMDQLIASVLLNKIPSDARIVMVGDPDQLPSVGCGNVLWDLIHSGRIPVTKLNVIYRQSGTNPIVENSARIHEGRSDLMYTNTFKFIRASEDEELFNRTCDFYLKCVKAYGKDSVLLLNPQRNNTAVSVSRFNSILQNTLNPAGDNVPEIHIGRLVFRPGDRIMQLKNTERAKNGDTGYVREIRKRPDEENPGSTITEAIVEFNDDGVMQAYSMEDMRSVDLAYCSTVHKAQGEEFKVVILVCSMQHRAMLKRNLIYTGITRAKQYCALIGQEQAVETAIKDNRVSERYSLLAQRIAA